MLRDSPQSVTEEYRSGCHDSHRAVVLLCQQLQVVCVFPLPLGAAVLEPDLDLQVTQSSVINVPVATCSWRVRLGEAATTGL